VRRLDLKRYVYLWTDGIYFNVRNDDDRTCLLVIIGVTESSQKELISIEYGYRESTQSWLEVLHDIKSRGLTVSPKFFPAEHWTHIRTTNPIEPTFATVRHRTNKTKNCMSRISILAMVFKLVKCTEKRWNKLRGFKWLADVYSGRVV